jgi:hypothetical protein
MYPISPAVIRDAGRRQHRRRAAVGAALALAVAAALFATQPWQSSEVASHRAANASATAESQPGPWELFGLIGPGVFTLKPANPGRVCFTYKAGGTNASGCTHTPRSALSRPFYVASRSNRELVLGLASRVVDHVGLRLPGGAMRSSGRLLGASTSPFSLYASDLPVRVYAFDARVTAGNLGRSTLFAYGLGGKVVGRVAA